MNIFDKIELLKKIGFLHVDEVGTTNECHVHNRTNEHLFSVHTPVWAYCDPKYTYPFDHSLNQRPLFDFFPSFPGLEVVLSRTNLLIFFGLTDSSLYAQVKYRPDVIKIIIEPDMEYFKQFIQDKRPVNIVSKNAFCLITGRNWSRLNIEQFFIPKIFNFGFPVFFTQNFNHDEYNDYVKEIIEYIEILYYRYVIYPIEGQSNQRGLPLRRMYRGLFFDQQKHVYENTYEYMIGGKINQLKNKFRDRTALCIGAGPDLDNKIGYIKENKDKSVVICVNNALRVLLKNNIEPHFVVINDTSIAVEKSFASLPELKHTILIAHCFSPTGGKIFKRKFFFSNYLQALFGIRDELFFHGSVITTAFDFAKYIGCSTIVFIGAQLASMHPYSFMYSKQSIHGKNNNCSDMEQYKFINKFPQLYPVRSASGELMFTTLNLFDVSLWLLNRIDDSNVKVVNSTYDTILFGKNIEINENYKIDYAGNISKELETIDILMSEVNLYQVKEYLYNETVYWNNIKRISKDILSLSDSCQAVDTCQRYISEFDKTNISYLLQRYDDFDNFLFHDKFFSSQDIKNKYEGGIYYFSYLYKMSDYFLRILNSQAMKLN